MKGNRNEGITGTKHEDSNACEGASQRTATDVALLSMLRENTGTHFLDSGGELDRHWQQNQARDIEHEDACVVSFKFGEISVTHRLYHWLRERLEFDDEATKAFDGPFRVECDPEDDRCWGELRETFPEWFAHWKSITATAEPHPSCGGGRYAPAPASEDLYRATGIHGDGEPVTVNSYNEESALDQVILFTYFELRSHVGRAGNHGAYVVLQLHGDCDVRGGYTRPRVFVLDDELAIFDFRRGAIVCDRRDAHWWSTDDGRHWYPQGACGTGAGCQLERYERFALIRGDEPPAEGACVTKWRRDVLCVTTAGDGLCPLCGGLLRGSSR